MSVSAAPSRHNSIPGTRGASPQRQLLFETPQGQDHRTSGRGSEDAVARVLSKGAPQLSLGAHASPSPPLGPITRRHAHRQAMLRLVQYDDNNSSEAGSESQGSESHLHRANLRCDKDYCPSHTEAKVIGLRTPFNDAVRQATEGWSDSSAIGEECERQARRLTT
ncbi:hypothetical protein B0J13DRAFT_653907 [Dactylonectria estremocensis]|uniref:Uncharacterized protein n=1 Tax=Dactylonectria estremocensis TaxID=1079267 RepID=A0A9P9DAY0_9HYPO|nr:hypothetical protein B0J13DRAFT_653907 [Dactylonectria estremocensis]